MKIKKQSTDTMQDSDYGEESFSVPWQYDIASTGYSDPDIDEENVYAKEADPSRERIQEECWLKFHRNPQINTAVRGIIGRLTGFGFDISSDIQKIQEVLDETIYDFRNRLYINFQKFVGRSYIEGELFLCLTCHTDSFIEVDFIDTSSLHNSGDGSTGIIYHPTKQLLPLFYIIKDDTGAATDIIPSIYIARDASLIKSGTSHTDYKPDLANKNKGSEPIYKQFGGFKRFIVHWDKGMLTRRNTSYIRTTLEWINHYENLKKYEIDHKKSSGSYLWLFRFTEPRLFKLWCALSEADRQKTGIMAKKTPGSSLVLPPGMEVECINPSLSAIKEQDTDILEMVASGLNEPSDIMTGSSKGTFASVKASRGPMSDRISDEASYFEKFLKFDFWASIFYLKNKLTKGAFPDIFKVKEAISFKENGEPVFANVKKKPEFLIDISFPVSEMIDMESRARALLGVKHGPISENLGIPYSEVARKMGFSSYGKLRLKQATELDKYPELVYNTDQETVQENQEGEPTKKEESPTKKIKKKSGGSDAKQDS